MPTIHPTAILDGDINLADDVEVGPNCVLRGRITIGAGTRLIGNCYLTGTLSMGTGNIVYPFACLGFAAQDVNYPGDMYDPGVSIGSDNQFREYTSVHRATQETPTTIGDRNIFMSASHAGHDVRVASDCTFVSGAMLGGHAWIDDHAIIGGGSGIHQFVRVGTGAMVAGIIICTLDLPPWFLMSGTNNVTSPNLVGMRRSGMPREEIDRRRAIFKLTYRQGLTAKQVVEALRGEGDAVALEYADFIEQARKGACAGQQTRRRLERRGSHADA